MKQIIIVFTLLCCVHIVQAQNNQEYRIIRSNLGSSGSSQTVTTTKGVFTISQSIGQSSVIGTHYNNGYYIRQGYQQPLDNLKTVKDSNHNLIATVHPNPFNQDVTIVFSNTIKNDVSISTFDINGKLIYTQNYLPTQEINLKLTNISSGIYVLKVHSGTLFFNTKLIKL
ncbi:T9SS type A sorting domain-containing protein [Psychroserpens sp.]|uniref:T9SS type A sorting domain-containing protein n=1 Tax=Psychroserpens sp. TaxID=2020870 RepID=UPI002B2779E4|nr:T9SS type A sorting domain-containing protein [Psychroserpens sp.]